MVGRMEVGSRYLHKQTATKFVCDQIKTTSECDCWVQICTDELYRGGGPARFPFGWTGKHRSENALSLVKVAVSCVKNKPLNVAVITRDSVTFISSVFSDSRRQHVEVSSVTKFKYI